MQKPNILQSAQQKKKLIYQKDLEDGNILASQAALDTSIFYTIKEISTQS